MAAVEEHLPQNRPRRLAFVALAGLTLVALVSAYLYRNRGGPLLLGACAGVGIALSVAAGLAWLKPVTDLAVAVRPLGVPLLLVLAAGTIESPLPLQLLAGAVAFLIAWNLLVKPEIPEAEAVGSEVLQRLGGWPGARQLARGAAKVLFTVAIVWTVRESGSEALEERGGFASLWFAGALTLLLVALALRIAGYATSRLRFAVSLLAFAAGYRVVMQIGIVPGYTLLQKHTPWLSAGLLLLLAAAGVVLAGIWELVAPRLKPGRGLRGDAWKAGQAEFDSPARTARLRSLGLASCVLAALALFVAMVLSANAGRASGVLDSRLGAGPPGRATLTPAEMTDDQLARTYAPVLVFSARERWAPEPVTGFLKDVRVNNWNGEPVEGAHVRSLTSCPGIVPAPCYSLTIDCSAGGDSCAGGHTHPSGEQGRDGTVYVRVFRREKPPEDDSPNPFGPFGPWGEPTTILLQYWLFYRYDEWVSPVVAGQLEQHHEADWEAVTIGFADDRPLFMGLSEHCGGQWYPWKDVKTTGAQPRVRPLVAVATGSHANYLYPNPAQAPDWTGCASMPARTTTLLSYASNIRDRTGADWSWEPRRFVPVNGRTYPMNIVARWAPYSRTELVTPYRRQRLGQDAFGPATPSLQLLWSQPMRTIFHSRTWHPGAS
ncbi:hypothetical protein OM076_05970 [Solirubrobacter ginsenosidimutans]|uniref:Uncharacterized protein n=1 Tax=Solirubrobacter ginsenosidimutans TaxID=490573 RepID=A0A9X3MRE4_9ACTN|nr:hypothetical protein [Solirubrobacter ginsenosidimutans]MDA0159800.1 hypothetical protein [Solirubrobacter ginsenosidimutans]